MNAIEFLKAIFQDEINSDRQLSIFCLPSRKIKRFEKIEAAVKFSQKQSPIENVYFGLGLIGGKPRGRGKATDVVGIGSLWADIDIADEQHSKPNLPPNEAEARKIIAGIPLKPSLIVNSGGGLHVYWILKEVWIFDKESERIAAATLCKRLSLTLWSIAESYGYEIDNVSDLSRVLRLPATLNYKYKPSAKVKIIERNDERYTSDDFVSILLDEEFCDLSGAPVVIDDIVLQADAEPPGSKLSVLQENDTNFRRSWKRSNSKLSDQSASAYCLSLANATVAAGWSDQEITNLIIAWRRIHKDNPEKALRWDWIRNYILKPARTSMQGDFIGQLAKAVDKVPDSTAKRKFILQQVSQILGIQISRWLQHGKVNALYSMQLTNGQWISMGTVADVMTPKSFKHRIYEAADYVIPDIKSKKWKSIYECLAQTKEFVDNPEAAPNYQVQQWINSFLKNSPRINEGDWQFKADSSYPLLKDGQLHIHTTRLRKHIRIICGEKVTNHRLCEYMRLAGFIRTSLSYRYKSIRSTKSYWARPFDVEQSFPVTPVNGIFESEFAS